MHARTNEMTPLAETIHSSMSPQALAALIAWLAPATTHRGTTPVQRRVHREINGLHDALLEVLGVGEFNRLVNEVGL